MKTKKYFREIFEQNSKQDPTIDGIRALSVLSIIAFHVLIGVVQVFDSERAKNFILELPTFLQPLWHGEKGVDAFFLISGLLVGLPFFKETTNNPIDFLGFYKKKLLRIYPLFLVALIIYTIAQWEHFRKFFFSNVFFVNNLISGERTIIPVGWFLTVEMQYFIFVPPLFWFLKRAKLSGRLLCGLFSLSFVATAAALVTHPQLYVRPLTDLFLATDKGEFSNLMGTYFYEADLTRFGPFVAGLLLAYLKTRYPETLGQLFKNRAQSFILLALAGVFIAVPLLTPVYHPESWFYSPFSAKLNFFYLMTSRQFFSIGVAILLLGCSYASPAFSWVSKILKWRAWQPISKLSFPIYLFHFPFIAIAAVAVFGTTNTKEIMQIGFGQGLLIFLLATVLTTLFSIPLYIYVERPFTERPQKN